MNISYDDVAVLLLESQYESYQIFQYAKYLYFFRAVQKILWPLISVQSSGIKQNHTR